MKFLPLINLGALLILNGGCASPQHPFDPLAQYQPPDASHPHRQPLYDFMPDDWQRKEDRHENFEKAFGRD